jgi:hypothetical protein
MFYSGSFDLVISAMFIFHKFEFRYPEQLTRICESKKRHSLPGGKPRLMRNIYPEASVKHDIALTESKEAWKQESK